MPTVLEWETTHYTSWRCKVCFVWRDRTYPVRIIRTGSKETLQCLEHNEDEEDDECGCHCHSFGFCEQCGEPS
jgi:hypothetical protein